MPPKTSSAAHQRVNAAENVAMTDREHILERPEIYIQSVDSSVSSNTFLTADMRLVRKEVCTNFGLVHLMAEALSNGADNAVKNGAVAALAQQLQKRGKRPPESICRESAARMDIELTPRYMAVTNYGAPFDIDFMAPTRAGGPPIFIPDACFTQTKVGSNFSDDERPRIGVGRNGIGAKLITTFSKEFELECVDVLRGRYFRMTIANNGDPATKRIRVWPESVMQDGRPVMLPHPSGPPPEDLAGLFAGESYTRVKWYPDSEEGDLTPEAIGALGAEMVPGDKLIIRRLTPSKTNPFDVEEGVMQVTMGGPDPAASIGGANVRLATIPGLRMIRNVRAKTSAPPTVLVFRGGSWISDDEIDLAARYTMDFAVCGIPFILRRQWSDGRKVEQLVPPLTVREYGARMFGDVKAMSADWASKDGNIRCSVAFFDTPGEGVTLGFVNGLWADGGMHVAAAYGALWDIIKENPAFQKYQGVDVKALKAHVSVVVLCMGSNPTQEGQTKKNLSMISGKKSFKIDTLDPRAVASMVTGSGVWDSVKAILEELESRKSSAEVAALKSKLAGRKTEGYIPANKLGPEATLILTEGDSCRAYGAIMRNQQPDPDRYGILAIRGVPANLYEGTAEDSLKNEMLATLLKVSGLDPECQYLDPVQFERLKYGSFIFMGDPDLDGFHIISLMLANMEHYWPGLFVNRRVGALRTPVVRIFASGGKNVLARYFSDREYDDAVKSGMAPTGDVKRIKGLGSVDVGTLDKAGDELLDDVAHASISWFDMQDDGREALRVFFAAGKSSERKFHIGRLAGDCTNTDGHHVVDPECGLSPMGPAPMLRRNVCSYVSKELIQYSLGSLVRAIPLAHDGWKDSQRKLAAWWLETHRYGETNGRGKVEQIAGKVADKQDYHHGTQSLGAAAKRMAMSGFPGSNNLPFFHPESNVGSKLNFPKDAAGDRYAFIKGAPWLKYAIHKHLYESIDRCVSNGDPIEPLWIPCDIPMALMNGIRGISTGWQTYLPPCHPGSVVSWLIERASAESEGRAPQLPEVPFWYVGFKGTLEIVSKCKAAIPVDPADSPGASTSEGGAGDAPSIMQEWGDTAFPPPEEEFVESAILARGVYRIENPTPAQAAKGAAGVLIINEVPPENRLDALTAAIQDMERANYVSSFTNSTKDGIDFRVCLTPEGVALGEAGVIKMLRLIARYPLTNFNLLELSGAPRLFADVYEYLEFFYRTHVGVYALGLRRQIDELEKAREKLLMKRRYIASCLAGEIRLGAMAVVDLLAALSRIEVEMEMTKMSARDITQEGIEKTDNLLEKNQEQIQRLSRVRPCAMYAENLRILAGHLPKTQAPVKIGPKTWGPAPSA
jgi:DNA gyrase/topoisomerase IV subunit B